MQVMMTFRCSTELAGTLTALAEALGIPRSSLIRWYLIEMTMAAKTKTEETP